jgi:FkbM family methyltransferase
MLEYIHRLRIGGNYVDAGAAIGNHTLFFAVVCGAAHVDAFEPRDWVFDLLVDNVALNRLDDRVTAHPVGLGAADGEVTAVLDRRTTTFEVRPLDDLVQRKVSVLKIDVEDMEVEVLQGARRILRADRPLVFAEARTPELHDALVTCMRANGYRPTGRVFNATPTYEFVSRPGPWVRVQSAARRGKRVLVQRSPLARRLLVGLPRRLRRRR